MAVIEFVQNYTDLSTDQGYQFRFHCDHCGNGFQSSYVSNKLNVAGDLLKAASGFLGGILGNVGNGAYDIQRAVGGPVHDKALRDAVEEIKPLFEQCHRCGTWVCRDVCWNSEKRLCKQCAPVLGEEVGAAQAEAMRNQVREKAYEFDQTQGADLSQQRTAKCHGCGADTGAAKFCPECGTPVSQKRQCASCHTEVAAGVKFCPECGTRM
jgi:hypothetical protein